MEFVCAGETGTNLPTHAATPALGSHQIDLYIVNKESGPSQILGSSVVAARRSADLPKGRKEMVTVGKQGKRKRGISFLRHGGIVEQCHCG